jgi:hypothetical protein
VEVHSGPRQDGAVEIVTRPVVSPGVLHATFVLGPDDADKEGWG